MNDLNTPQKKRLPVSRRFSFSFKQIQNNNYNTLMETPNQNNKPFAKRLNNRLSIHIYCGGISSYPNFSFNSALQKVISQWSAKWSISADHYFLYIYIYIKEKKKYYQNQSIV